MASLLDNMRAERDSGNAAYGLFLLDFKRDASIIYNFLEGEEDLPYYEIRIAENAHGFLIKVYSCNGKKNVIEVFDLINSIPEYAATRFGFFVDRDFDPPLNNPNIYETPFHSIENFFTDISTLERVYRNIYHINEQSDDFGVCIALYNSLFEEFHDYVSPINAWISCYIDKKNNDAILKQVNINRLTENLFLNVVENSLEGLNREHVVTNFNELQLFFDNSVDINELAFEQKLAHFQQINRAHLFRGKFEIRFLTKFLHVLKHKLEGRNNGISQGRYPHPHRFDLNTIMVLLNSFALTTNDLRNYIRNITV